MYTELQGQLERVTYCNESNHYTIARLKVQGRRDLVTIVGNLLSVAPGEVLRLQGTWERHPRYGEQFKIASYESVLPATIKGIERYLGSGLIKGIGPVMAKRLVEKFGQDTLVVIETKAERLAEVDGIGSKRIGMIKKAWDEQKEVRDVMLFLQGHEVSTSYAVKIYRQYGKNSVRVVRENPYRLASEIFGIGFLTADKIAEKLGIPRDSSLRAEAGILHILGQFAAEGHVYYPFGPLTEECQKMLAVDNSLVIQAIEKISSEKKILVEDVPEGGGGPERPVYLAEFLHWEKGIAESLAGIMARGADVLRFDREKAIEDVQRDLGITLAANQVRAVKEALDKKVLVITGGPGTGKTTIVRSIIKICGSQGRKVVLGAPTGRAAKRLSEASGQEAKTIHRLLEFSPKQGGFKRNADFPLNADMVVIDEASMIDTALMYHLLKGVPGTAALVLVGDADQLPSVGAGNVLADIICSRRVSTVKLDEIFRQSGESLIIVNAHRINHGDFPFLSSKKEVPQDFYFIELEDPEEVCRMILNMCGKKIPEKFGLDPMRDIQVLAPMHRGVVGATNLNFELQKHLNPSGDELLRGEKALRRGDKVMQIRNNYDKDIYNGDIGRILSIDREEQELTVDYDGKLVQYDFTELDEIVLAYAVSVHKSQGSEYPAVVMPLLTQHYMMLQRNLLYTAITRGKKLVVLIGTRKALGIAIRNDKPKMRYTRLKERLQTALPNRPDIP
ncbi:MAG: ATP-dependent RecD-like DNA helicase [Nitrospiraceae bacterium]|nr:ATP-dependent RecD-like DNA helicase [Nitrospiraceae bacterium]